MVPIRSICKKFGSLNMFYQTLHWLHLNLGPTPHFGYHQNSSQVAFNKVWLGGGVQIACQEMQGWNSMCKSFIHSWSPGFAKPAFLPTGLITSLRSFRLCWVGRLTGMLGHAWQNMLWPDTIFLRVKTALTMGAWKAVKKTYDIII